MSEIPKLVQALKQCLKNRNMTYAEVAEKLAVSEASIKRAFSKNRFTLDRLSDICALMDMQLTDLIRYLDESLPTITMLTPEQESELLADGKLLLMTYLVINHWQLSEITHIFDLTEHECIRYLARLEQLKMIELLPGNRIKLLTARNFSWRKDGPIQRFFNRLVQKEFFASKFEGDGETMAFVGGMLSRRSVHKINQSIQRLLEQYDALMAEDADLPADQRYGCSLVAAMRPWEISVFTRYRREENQKRF